MLVHPHKIYENLVKVPTASSVTESLPVSCSAHFKQATMSVTEDIA